MDIDASLKRGEGSFNAEPAVILGIQKQPGVNTLELTHRLDAVIADLRATLPEGMEIQQHIFRQADFIQVSIDNVAIALRDGAVLVVVIVLFFLFSGRATLITALTIPLSLVTAVLVIRWLGGSLNTMTLGGMAIAVGALVDDAIIDVENFATLIIVLVFVPLFFLHGVEGRLLAPLGLAYVVSLGASLTVTPALASGLGLLPLELAAGEPGAEIQAPMAAVILYGLISSTLLNMFVVPALYLRFGARGKMWKKPVQVLAAGDF